jgi:hypothetical protein
MLYARDTSQDQLSAVRVALALRRTIVNRTRNPVRKIVDVCIVLTPVRSASDLAVWKEREACWLAGLVAHPHGQAMYVVGMMLRKLSLKDATIDVHRLRVRQSEHVSADCRVFMAYRCC